VEARRSNLSTFYKLLRQCREASQAHLSAQPASFWVSSAWGA
jgi:hypothetical protein